jgi:hypothetical protein
MMRDDVPSRQQAEPRLRGGRRHGRAWLGNQEVAKIRIRHTNEGTAGLNLRGYYHLWVRRGDAGDCLLRPAPGAQRPRPLGRGLASDSGTGAYVKRCLSQRIVEKYVGPKSLLSLVTLNIDPFITLPIPITGA